MKLCWLLNDCGEVVAWDCVTVDVHDQNFLPLIAPFVGETIVLADKGLPMPMTYLPTSSSVHAPPGTSACWLRPQSP